MTFQDFRELYFALTALDPPLETEVIVMDASNITHRLKGEASIEIRKCANETLPQFGELFPTVVLR